MSFSALGKTWDEVTVVTQSGIEPFGEAQTVWKEDPERLVVKLKKGKVEFPKEEVRQVIKGE